MSVVRLLTVIVYQELRKHVCLIVQYSQSVTQVISK